jgi:SAM-dependent methyltransferase
LTSEYFDNWHANNTRSPARDAIHRRHLGLPPYMTSDSLLPWEGIAEVTEELRLKPGDTLLDLACGRGAYGLEIARRTGARLIGVDFAESAVQAARALAASLGQDADFRVADMAVTGLAQGSVDAVLSVDSAQFGGDGVFVELRRLLVPGGRVALTGWEALRLGDESVGKAIRDMGFGDSLRGAGFVDVEVRERPSWQERERAMWEDAAALDPGDDPALRSLHDEAVSVLPSFGRLRRVLAVAVSPPAAS